MDCGRHFHAEITARRDLAPDLWIVRVRPEQPLSFRPGQFATLGLFDGPKMIERSYSIASSPRDSEFEFFLELVPQGELSGRLHELSSRDRLYVRKTAKGNLRLDEKSGHKTHFMVATVTGVAPFVSMVRTLRFDEQRGIPVAGHRIVLLHGASRSWEFGYDKELAILDQEVSWFRYTPVVSRPWEDPSWAGEVGRLPGLLLKYLDRLGCDFSQTTVYLCGNPMMIEAGKGILLGGGFEKPSIREERFWVQRN